MKKLDMIKKLAIFRPGINFSVQTYNTKLEIMKKLFRILLCSMTLAVMLVSCDKSAYDPAQDPNNNNGKPGTEATTYTIDKDGYATYEYKGFTYKFKKEVISTDAAQKAMAKVKSDIDQILLLIPEDAVKVMQKNPIWFEENNSKNTSAAWYHRGSGSGLAYGGLAAKEKCVEITNYKYYVDWTAQNQPFMVLHELCHLYHDHGLGGDANNDITSAYTNAKNKGLYKTYYYRTSLSDTKGTAYQESGTQHAYCMTDKWEFFAEMSEAYWGENDYYPFNYIQLKEHDPFAFAIMEKIWGKRF